MKRLFIYFFLGILIIALPLTVWKLVNNSQKSRVLGEVITPSPTPTAIPTPVPTETPTPTPTQRPTPTPKPTLPPPPPASSAEINAFIERFSSQYSVDPNILRYIAICESGFNPLTRNSPYAGLYQFGPTTWQNYRVKMGEDKNTNLRFNAEEAVQTAAYVLSINQAYIWPNCYP